MNTNVLKRIVKLNEERYGTTFNKDEAIEKLREELREFEEAQTLHDAIDALDDLIVIATGEIRKLQYDPNITMDETLKEIESRKQDPDQAARWECGDRKPGEKWLKDRNQSNDTLYKANYKKAKLTLHPTNEYEIDVEPEKKEWYECIPDEGIICWIGRNKTFVRIIEEYYPNTECPFEDNEGNLWKYAEPIKPEECWQVEL